MDHTEDVTPGKHLMILPHTYHSLHESDAKGACLSNQRSGKSSERPMFGAFRGINSGHGKWATPTVKSPRRERECAYLTHVRGCHPRKRSPSRLRHHVDPTRITTQGFPPSKPRHCLNPGKINTRAPRIILVSTSRTPELPCSWYLY